MTAKRHPASVDGEPTILSHRWQSSLPATGARDLDVHVDLIRRCPFCNSNLTPGRQCSATCRATWPS